MKRWTNEEIEFLKENNKSKTGLELAFYLRRTEQSVYHKLFRLGISVIGTGKWKHTIESKKKIGIKNTGKRNNMWKEDVGYNALHAWVRRNKKKPIKCEYCSNKPIDLANISGEYRRDINDFVWLCRKCHMESDNRLEKFKQNHWSKLGLRPWNYGGGKK
jgi:hypothetical protein